MLWPFALVLPLITAIAGPAVPLLMPLASLAVAVSLTANGACVAIVIA